MKNKYLFLVMVVLFGTLFPAADAYASGIPIEIGIARIENAKKAQMKRVIDELKHNKKALPNLSIPKPLSTGMLPQVNSNVLNNKEILKNIITPSLTTTLGLNNNMQSAVCNGLHGSIPDCFFLDNFKLNEKNDETCTITNILTTVFTNIGNQIAALLKISASIVVTLLFSLALTAVICLTGTGGIYAYNYFRPKNNNKYPAADTSLPLLGFQQILNIIGAYVSNSFWALVRFPVSENFAAITFTSISSCFIIETALATFSNGCLATVDTVTISVILSTLVAIVGNKCYESLTAVNLIQTALNGGVALTQSAR